MGRRIAKRVYSGGTGGTVGYTRFVYRGGHVAFETDSAGAIGLRYTWGLATDDLLAIRDAAGNHYYTIQDKLRSVRGLVKRDGTWVASLTYRPYGGALADTVGAEAPTWELRYRWTGREFDSETGWYFFRARYYDPDVRRFVQEDPIGYAGGENLYAYVGGNPVDRRDPSGLVFNLEDYYGVTDLRRIPFGGGSGGSTWDEYEFIPDGHGGGEWMPPGMSAAAQAMFAAGVVGMGHIRELNTMYVVTVATSSGGAAEIITKSLQVALTAIAANAAWPTSAPGPDVFTVAAGGGGPVIVPIGGHDRRFADLPTSVSTWVKGIGIRGFVGRLRGEWERVGEKSCAVGVCSAMYTLQRGSFDGFRAMGYLNAISWFRVTATLNGVLWFWPPLPSLYQRRGA